MTITITLPPTTEQRLRQQAQATGKDINTLIVEAIEARLTLAQLRLRDILAPVHEDFRKSGMSQIEIDARLGDALAEVRSKKSPD